MGQEDKALALSAVARRFHVNRKTILRWIKRGKLKGFRTLGGHYRVWSKDLESFLEKSGVTEEPVSPGMESPGLIFIVDDDPAYHDPLRMIIEQSFGAVEIRSYENGYQALIDIGRLRPAVILLDIRMPHIDGLEVMKAIEAMNSGYRPRILIISGYIDPPMERRLSGTIAAARLSKPFTADALVTALSALGIKPLLSRVHEPPVLSVPDVYRGGQ